jgi:hypothetical protein
MRILVRDFLASNVIVVIPFLIAGWGVSVLSWPKLALAASLPALLPLHLVYLVPIGLLVHGVRARNLGVVAGVLAAGAGLYLWLAYTLWAQYRVIREIESTTIAPAPDTAPPMLLMDSKAGCDELCVQVLAAGGRDIAIAHAGKWWIYRRAEGEACEQNSALTTRLMFLTRGYLGLCAQVLKTDLKPDGILVAEYSLDGKGNRTDDAVKVRQGGDLVVEHPVKNELAPIHAIAMQLPGFVGNIYERGVRLGGGDRTIEKRFDGTLSLPGELLTFSLAPGPIRLGSLETRAEIYRRALDRPLKNVERPGPEVLNTLFDVLERELMVAPAHVDVRQDSPAFTVADAFGRLSSYSDSAEAPVVRARIDRFLRSDRAALIDAGLYAMSIAKVHDPAEIEDAVQRLLESGNPAVVANALRKAVYYFEIDDRPEVRRRILEIPFRPELLAKGSPLAPEQESVAQLIARRFSPNSDLLMGQLEADAAYIRRATEYLRTAAYITTGHCEILLSIMAHRRDEAGKRAALDALLASEPPVFSSCISVLQGRGRNLLPSENLDQAQVAALVARADLVPSWVLVAYWRQFLSSKEARARRDEQMISLVRDRLNLASPDYHPSPRDRSRLEELLRDLTRN